MQKFASAAEISAEVASPGSTFCVHAIGSLTTNMKRFVLYCCREETRVACNTITSSLDS